jgi:hypothetical protein
MLVVSKLDLWSQDYWVFGLCQTSGILECRTMDKVQNSINPECYAQSSEPFRIYHIFYISIQYRLSPVKYAQ